MLPIGGKMVYNIYSVYIQYNQLTAAAYSPRGLMADGKSCKGD